MTGVPFDIRREVAAEGIAVVAVAGEADLYTAPALQEHISAALTAGATRLVVDLTDVTFIDSTTIGVLVHGERQLRPRNGRVALVVTDANVARVFAITALDRVFAIHTTRADAVAQLAGHAGSESSADGGPAGAEDGAIPSAS